MIYKVIDGASNTIEVIDETGDSVQFYSGQRVVLTQSLPTELLPSGNYEVQVEVYDEIRGQAVEIVESFNLNDQKKQ